MARVAGVSIDSRTIRAGELFVAIHGPTHDGHDHVAAAMESGAAASVVAEPLLRAIRDGSRTAASPLLTRSRRCTVRPEPSAKVGQESLRDYRLGRQNYNERDRGGTAWFEVTGAEDGGKF